MDKQKWNEQLSNCMDGELDNLSVFLDKMDKLEETKDLWHRYHLIGDIIRDDKAPQLPIDFSSRVLEKIASDPIPTSNYIAKRRRKNFVSKHIIRPVAGLAIAASVAVLTVVGLQSFQIFPFQATNNNYFASSTTPKQSTPSANKNDEFPVEIIPASVDKIDKDFDAYLVGQGVLPTNYSSDN